MSHATGYRVLKDESSRTLDSRVNLNPRHQPRVISPEKLLEMEKVLEGEGIEARGLTWEQLGTEVGLDVDGKTVKDALGTMKYHKCVACRKGWVDGDTATRRVDHSRVMLERYPHWTDWKHVRWSDEVHFGYGPEGPLNIIRKEGMRRCPDCIQHIDPPKKKKDIEQKRVHGWSSIGWDHKGPMVFYDAGNDNGKMTQRCYIDQILEPVVKPWLEAGEQFVLEEDGDSGHGTSPHNIVKSWKEKNGLKSYFNCAGSPDFSIIENTWSVPKAWLRKMPHWDEKTTKELVLEGWDEVPQGYINDLVKTIPDRYKACLKGYGQMTAY